MSPAVRWKSQVYFHKVDKIAYGSSYMILKLWEIHNFIFMNVSKIPPVNKRVDTVVSKVKNVNLN